MGLARVPVHVAKDLTPAQLQAYRIADNRTADLAVWDMELLPLELADLKDLNYDLSLLGWSGAELSEIMAPAGNEGLTDPDDFPSAPDAATTVHGEIWVLGNHRLMCGDSANAEHLDLLLDGAPIHLVNTDPPYNVRVDRSNNAIVAGLSSFALPGKADTRPAERPQPLPRRAAPRTRNSAQGPATHQRLRVRRRGPAMAAWFGNIARVLIPAGFYLGRRELRQLPAGQALRIVLPQR